MGRRTVLVSIIFCQTKWRFILRIEDTDQNRFVPGAEEYIIEALKWTGILPNERCWFWWWTLCALQTKWTQRFVQRACWQTDPFMRIMLLTKRKSWSNCVRRWNHKSKHLLTRIHACNWKIHSLSKGRQTNCFLRRALCYSSVPADEESKTDNIIRGPVSVVLSSQMDDKVVVQKSDGMPTSSCECGWRLPHKITHVIRGEGMAHPLLCMCCCIVISDGRKWYRSLHLPLPLKPDGNGKLNKRDGDRLGFPVFPLNWIDPETKRTFIQLQKGYYPAAFVNMLSLLGWHPSDDKELFSMDELIRASPGKSKQEWSRFDPEKTKWFNEQYLRQQPDTQLAAQLRLAVKAKYHFADTDHRMQESFCMRSDWWKEKNSFWIWDVGTGGSIYLAPVAWWAGDSQTMETGAGWFFVPADWCV